MARAKLTPKPESGALTHHCSCGHDELCTSRWQRGAGLAIAFWHNPVTSRNVGSCCFAAAPQM
eukprot:2538115-Lingulodinium_polyedra.AAC.1